MTAGSPQASPGNYTVSPGGGPAAARAARGPAVTVTVTVAPGGGGTRAGSDTGMPAAQAALTAGQPELSESRVTEAATGTESESESRESPSGSDSDRDS